MTIHFPSVPATFRNVPRTGSTSFKYWVRANIQDREILIDPEHPNMLAHRSLDQIKELWPNYGTTFGFVRNPYDRLVSIFHFVGQDAKKRLKKRVNNSDFEDLTRIPIESDLKILFQYNKGFDHWIRNKHRDDGAIYAALSMLNNKDEETQMYHFSGVAPDVIVKLENMTTEFVKIQELLGCNVSPMHVNSSLHGDYRDYYTDDTRKIASRWLEQDLDTFKYTF